MLDAGLSVLMLEAGPRVDRWRIVENFRNLPPTSRLHFDAPYPPTAWAPHLESSTDAAAAEYLQLEGPNARAYRQGYVRYAGGATWHWAGICWRLTPQDMRMKSLYGVARDWDFDYGTLEPYYTRRNTRLAYAVPPTRPYNGRRYVPSLIRWDRCPSARESSALPTPRLGSA